MSATFRSFRPLAARNLVRPTAAATATTTARSFHASTAFRVAAGDALPNVDALCEDSPGNKVNLADEFKNTRGVIIGVPAAFSGACSQQHVPGYMKHPQTREILGMGGKVFVVSVNDAFVCVLPSLPPFLQQLSFSLSLLLSYVAVSRLVGGRDSREGKKSLKDT